MKKEHEQLLEKATGVPCRNASLTAKAQKIAQKLDRDVLVLRIGEDQLQALADICSMEPNGDQALADAASVISQEAEPVLEPEPEPEPTTEPESEPVAEAEAEPEPEITLEDLEQMTKNELKKLAGKLGLKKSGTVKDLFQRTGAYLGLIED